MSNTPKNVPKDVQYIYKIIEDNAHSSYFKACIYSRKYNIWIGDKTIVDIPKYDVFSGEYRNFSSIAKGDFIYYDDDNGYMKVSDTTDNSKEDTDSPTKKYLCIRENSGGNPVVREYTLVNNGKYEQSMDVDVLLSRIFFRDKPIAGFYYMFNKKIGQYERTEPIIPVPQKEETKIIYDEYYNITTPKEQFADMYWNLEQSKQDENMRSHWLNQRRVILQMLESQLKTKTKNMEIEKIKTDVAEIEKKFYNDPDLKGSGRTTFKLSEVAKKYTEFYYVFMYSSEECVNVYAAITQVSKDNPNTIIHAIGLSDLIGEYSRKRFVYDKIVRCGVVILDHKVIDEMTEQDSLILTEIEEELKEMY